ncbi:RBBP9/YdeN family alpha/beta hydrolase [Vibrio owensii]|uniref:RBBP9/YdeN family alpha/beta hydrolase n=1 Tax=Vibrio owensii TaxID=696485 RepID=UPI0028940757|nr:conserved hypothetical protein [Vibrio owensii]
MARELIRDGYTSKTTWKSIMKGNILIIPGYKDSPKGHWQTWIEKQYPNAERLKTIDYHQPVLFNWSAHISEYLAKQAHPVTIVAHSFSCLAAVIAIKQHRPLVNAALLVAPASPIRFTKDGHTKKFPTSPTISSALPDEPLGITGLIVASQNDPWMDYEDACELSLKWGMPFHNVGDAGHINIESGHGPYPKVKMLLDSLIYITQT